MLTGYPDALVDVLGWGRLALVVGLVGLVLWHCRGAEGVGHDSD